MPEFVGIIEVYFDAPNDEEASSFVRELETHLAESYADDINETHSETEEN